MEKIENEMEKCKRKMMYRRVRQLGGDHVRGRAAVLLIPCDVADAAGACARREGVTAAAAAAAVAAAATVHVVDDSDDYCRQEVI